MEGRVQSCSKVAVMARGKAICNTLNDYKSGRINIYSWKNVMLRNLIEEILSLRCTLGIFFFFLLGTNLSTEVGLESGMPGRRNGYMNTGL